MIAGTRPGVLVGLTTAAVLVLAPGTARAEDGPSPRHVPRGPVPSAADPGRLAGTVAGQGRAHPGRAPEPSRAPAERPDEEAPPEEPGAAPEASETPAGAAATPVPDPSPSPTPSSPAPPPGPVRAEGRAAARGDASGAPPEHVMRVLPLGTGLTLTGLGIGFLGLRLRRR
ncbi:hypothetical protein [Streptomyces caatingaensis]|uniref:hypothetical protein n=1 Tax=Streptomyces caatingaensis TaxID=1678637 RepID=UPI0006727DB0|nr:hypothetical protein [Streptomyces caatingaensis]